MNIATRGGIESVEATAPHQSLEGTEQLRAHAIQERDGSELIGISEVEGQGRPCIWLIELNT